MNRKDYEALPAPVDRAPAVSVVDVDGPDRTLLYGYNVDRHSWHVYVQGGAIHRLITDHNGAVLDHRRSVGLWLARDLVPNKRVYPHATDVEFAWLLLRRGVALPFTAFADERADWLGFYRPTADDLAEQ